MGLEAEKIIEKRKKGPGKFWLYTLTADTPVPQEQVKAQAEEILKQCKDFVPPYPQEDYLEYDTEEDELPFYEIQLKTAKGTQPLYDIVHTWKRDQMRRIDLRGKIQMSIFVIIWCFDDVNTLGLITLLSAKLGIDQKEIKSFYERYRDEMIPKLSKLLAKNFPYSTMEVSTKSDELIETFRTEIAPKLEGYSSFVQLQVIKHILGPFGGSLLVSIHDHDSNAAALRDQITDQARRQLKELPKKRKKA